MVRDPVGGTVYEMGEEEYFLCQQLDGQSTEQAVLARFAAQYGSTIARDDLEAFTNQLARQGLLVGRRESRTFAEIFDPEEIIPTTRWRFGTGDRFFGWLADRLSWVFTLPVKALSVAVVVLGVVQAYANWDQGLREFFAHPGGPWFYLHLVVISVLLIQTPRTLAHGVLCKRYGGQITGVGLYFGYYIIPGFYCDWSSAMWLSQKSKRFWTVFSPIYFQVLTWSGAVLLWVLSEPEGMARSFWLQVALAAGLGILLFNANPLVKMDGYLLLTGWLEVQRLRERSLASFGAWVTGRPRPEALTPRVRRAFVLYGFLVIVYAVGHSVLFLSQVSAPLVEGLGTGGAIITLGVAMYLVQRPLKSILMKVPPVRWLVNGAPGRRRRLTRLALLVIVLIAMFLPYPYETGGAFTIIPSQRTEVHCENDPGGRIVQVFVKEGEVVRAQQPLALIDRRPYERNLIVTQAQLESDSQKLQLMYKDQALLTTPPHIELIRSLEADIRRLKTTLADAEKQLELTTLRAPMDGRVTTPLFEQAVGKYVKQGELVATVEQASAVRVEIQVPEGDQPLVKPKAAVKVVAWAYPMETFHAVVEEIAPIALSAAGSTVTTKSVRVVAAIKNPDLRLKSQLTGYAKIKAETMPVWQVLSRLIVRWFSVQVWYWIP